MTKKDIAKRPTLTNADVVHTVGRAIASFIPSGVELLNSIIMPPLEKRRDEWVESIAKRLVQLERDVSDLGLADLSKNDAFVSSVLQASRIAMRTHQEEKLEALRNAVLNSAIPGAPDDDLQLMFLNFVDTFTPWHLRVLAFLNDPKCWLDRNEVRYQHFSMGGISTVLDLAFPALASRSDFCDQLAKDLYVRGLLNTEELHMIMTADGMLSSRTTKLGKAFLKFTSEPVVARKPSLR
jgi:hypothetical protein